MAAHILVEASEVWDLFHREFFASNKPRLYERKIAENPELGTAIFMTGEEGKPNIAAYLDNEAVYEELCISELDCKTTVQKFYDDYLTEKFLNRYLDEDAEDDEDEQGTHFAQQSEIEDREAELDMAVDDFLSVAIDGLSLADFADEADVVCEDVKDHFCEYLARKWGLPIRRPMYLEDEDGEDFYAEYPYICMEFDDEDNPIYQ